METSITRFLPSFFCLSFQPPKEPREQRLREVRATRMFIKYKMTGMVEKVGKSSNEVTGPENVVFGTFKFQK